MLKEILSNYILEITDPDGLIIALETLSRIGFKWILDIDACDQGFRKTLLRCLDKYGVIYINLYERNIAPYGMTYSVGVVDNKHDVITMWKFETIIESSSGIEAAYKKQMELGDIELLLGGYDGIKS